MANKTVVFNNQVYSGTAGLTLLLISPTDGSIGNGAGDTLTAGSNGLFSCIVTENITGWWHVVVKNGATAILEGGQVYFQSNTLGTYRVDDVATSTQVAAVQAKTDNLPADPASASDITSLQNNSPTEAY